MAKVCDMCSRGPASANWRSHSNVAAKRRQHINLQSRRVAGGRMKVCTSCLRTVKKVVGAAA